MKNTLKKRVEKILQEHPETRNSDIALTIMIWQCFYNSKIYTSNLNGDQYIHLKDLYNLSREDNIKRIRAKFNAEGKYWPTDIKIVRARGLNEDGWRKDLGYPTNAETQNPTKQESYTAPAMVESEQLKCGECSFYVEKTLMPNIFQCPKGHILKK